MAPQIRHVGCSDSTAVFQAGSGTGTSTRSFWLPRCNREKKVEGQPDDKWEKEKLLSALRPEGQELFQNGLFKKTVTALVCGFSQL